MLGLYWIFGSMICLIIGFGIIKFEDSSFAIKTFIGRLKYKREMKKRRKNEL